MNYFYTNLNLLAKKILHNSKLLLHDSHILYYFIFLELIWLRKKLLLLRLFQVIATIRKLFVNII